MDNYIVINGKKAELTEEQLKQLGINVEKETPFTRNKPEGVYYFIATRGAVVEATDDNDLLDQGLYGSVNYFRDKNLAEQVALHQLLYRKLLKYAYEHDATDCDWNNFDKKKFYIVWQAKENKWAVDGFFTLKGSNIYFSDDKVANDAIEDVVKPFLKEYPEFVW